MRAMIIRSLLLTLKSMKRTMIFLAALMGLSIFSASGQAQRSPMANAAGAKPVAESANAADAKHAVTADTLTVKRFRYSGPIEVSAPVQFDSTDVQGRKFDINSLLDSPLSREECKDAYVDSVPPVTSKDSPELHLISFSAENRIFTKARLEVKGLEHYKLLVDGKEVSGEGLKLEPGTHEFLIKALSTPSDSTFLQPLISLIAEKSGRLSLREDGKHIYSLDANTIGLSSGGVEISYSGKYISLGYSLTDETGKYSYWSEIRDAKSGKTLRRSQDRVNWMPRSDRRYYTRENAAHGKDLYAEDPGTGAETLLARDIPEGSFEISPDETWLLYTLIQEGPKEGDVHQILTPDDRQPGWRDRAYLAKYDLKTGLLQQLTFGYHNLWAADISRDGKKILLMSSRERLTQRPTTLYRVEEMDVQTLSTRTLVSDDGFIRSASYSPDAKSVVLTGSAEAFGGIGKSSSLKEGQIPNEYDVRLFVLDAQSLSVTPLGVDFTPSVDGSPVWAAFDGKIYFKTEDKDVQNLYRADPKTREISKLANKEEYLYGFNLAQASAKLVYSGQSLCNGDRAYLYDLKSSRQTLLEDYSAQRFGTTVMGEGGAYEFTSSRGDVINGFYVLPPDFDPQKKYPLLVHYYGGCSPSARYCVGSYSPQVYAAQGYIFYVVNPSGAAGFGQEFAARHVNTAGDGVAEDIIEATRAFCKDHPYADSTKIGCFSASYGGFMTQLLLTKTNLYAAGISHAGISDHTSYWGEGYWGYSYSEVSMAGSYPWTRKDLYVDRSPLYNADKIHTPLLFLHGSADTNVPIGESIQMFTALKLLGQDTAFVVVDGENHGIRQFDKRRQWLRTIFAWFSKYLQDDSTWWDELYPPKDL